MIKRVIKTFEFLEERRSQITLGANVRLVPNENKVTLKASDTTGLYPTTADLFVKTWVTNPKSVKRWIAFQAVIEHKRSPIDHSLATSDGFRLGDGTNQFWWNGSAWEINTTSWNTEAEVAANIVTFPVTSQSLQVIVNLRTSDPKQTPELTAIKVGMRTDLESQDDVLNRTLLRQLRAQLRPYTEIPLSLIATGATFLMSNYKTDTPYEIVDVQEVYLDTDTHKLTNILQAYNPSTQQVTLTSSQPANTALTVRVVYAPVVAITTSQDYSEVQKVPAVIIEDISVVANEIEAWDEVVNKATGAAIQIKRPYQGNIDFALAITADKDVDKQRLSDEVKRFFANNHLLRTPALDEDVSIQILTDLDQSADIPSTQELHTSRLRARINNTLFFVRDALDAFGVLEFTANIKSLTE